MAKVTASQRFKTIGAKALLWLLALSFFAGFLLVPNLHRFSGGPQAEHTFAIVNDKHKVPVREFMETYRQMEYRYQEQYGDQWDQLKGYFGPQVKTNSLDRIIFRYGAGDKAKELGLSVSDEEVRRLVEETPTFHDEAGVFRVNLYQQFLQRRRMTAEKFEGDLREDLIRQKLTNLFYDGVRPSRAQVEEEWQNRNTKVALEFVSVDIQELSGSMKPSDAQIRDYYEKNQMEFFRPERRVLRYADFNPNGKEIRDRENVKNISDADIRAYYDQNPDEYTFQEENFRVREMVVGFDLGNPESEALKKLSDDDKKKKAREIIEEALKRVKAGEDFAAVANEVSTDRREKLLKKGGDLGLVSEKYFNKDVVEQAKKLALKDISPVFESFGSYRFVTVTEKFAKGDKKPFDDQKEAIRRKLANERAQAVADTESQQYLAKIKATGIPESGTAPEIVVSPPFARGEMLAGVGRLPQEDEDIVFGTLKPGDEPRLAKVGGRTLVYQLKEILQPSPSPLEEVKEQVAERVKKRLAREKLASEIEGVKKALASGTAPDKAAKAVKGAASGETGVFAKADSGSAEGVSGSDVVNKIGRSSELKLASFGLTKPGQVAGPFEVGEKLFVIRLKSRVDPDPAQRESQLNEVRDDLTRSMRSEVQMQLLEKIKADTKIEYKIEPDTLIKGDEEEAGS